MTRLSSVLGAMLACGIIVSGAPETIRFTDVTREAGIDFLHINGSSPDKHLVETMGSGGLFFDYDNDGWLDIFLVDGGSLADPAVDRKARPRLYRNRGNGSFEDTTARSNIRHTGYGMGACAGDVDNDGWIDLYVTGFGGNVLYRNRGDGTFVDATRSAGVGPLPTKASARAADARSAAKAARRCGARAVRLPTSTKTAIWISSSRTTWTSIPVARRSAATRRWAFAPTVIRSISAPCRTRSIGTTATASLPTSALHRASPTIAATASASSLPTTTATPGPTSSSPTTASRTSCFATHAISVSCESALGAGVAVATDGKPRAGMGVDAGDYDGDGRPDLVVTNLDFETDSLFRNLGDGLFAHATGEGGIGFATLPFVGFGVAFLDADNDGQLDLAIANGHVFDNASLVRSGATYAQRKLLFRNATGRRFLEIGRTAGPGFALEKVGPRTRVRRYRQRR